MLSAVLPSLSRILQNLDRRGLISRKTCGVDQRRSLISITAAGQRLVDQIAPLSEERYDDITRRFGEENLAALYQLLGELIDCMEHDDATEPD